MSYWDNPNVYGRAVWIAQLSNGEIAYQEDSRGICWAELKEKVEKTGLRITNLGLKYFDNEVWLGEHDGYYFTNGVLSMLHGPTFQMKNIGFVSDGKLIVRTYRCPELLMVEEEEREINETTIINTCTNHA